jgi:hypothetical protein
MNGRHQHITKLRPPGRFVSPQRLHHHSSLFSGTSISLALQIILSEDAFLVFEQLFPTRNTDWPCIVVLGVTSSAGCEFWMPPFFVAESSYVVNL